MYICIFVWTYSLIFKNKSTVWARKISIKTVFSTSQSNNNKPVINRNLNAMIEIPMKFSIRGPTHEISKVASNVYVRNTSVVALPNGLIFMPASQHIKNSIIMVVLICGISKSFVFQIESFMTEIWRQEIFVYVFIPTGIFNFTCISGQ